VVLRGSVTRTTLRAARIGDAVAIAALMGELEYPSTAEQAAERIARLADDPSMLVLVAEVDGEVAGLGALHVQNLVERDEPGCEVAALVVGERFRRRGIGELLMRAIEDDARVRGAKYVVLNTAHRRADAHAFYEALGYEHTGRRYAKELD
jgi:ribosomal protein S18 acetylase RimI-like enzyme